MQEFIEKKLDSMQNLEQKVIAKGLLNEVFSALYATSEKKYADLETRIREELPMARSKYTTYCSVLPKNKTDASHPYLRPMIPDKVSDGTVDLRDVSKAVDAGESYPIMTVFYHADYLQCRRLSMDKHIFNGMLIAGGENFPCKCRLDPATQYMDEIARLYSLFLRNGVPWTTINIAYLNKCFNVCVLSLDRKPDSSKAQPIKDIQIHFDQYEGKIKRDYVPVWNIEKHLVSGDDFPMPAEDKINYEYRFGTEKFGKNNGFLVDFDSASIQGIRFEGDSLVAVSPKPRGLKWDMFVFYEAQEKAFDSNAFPVLSNRQSESFSDRLLSSYGSTIKTKAELHRLVASFDTSGYIALDAMELSNTRKASDSYDMNAFIIDEIRDVDFQKSLILYFKATNREVFLNRDLISFVTSQVQYVYPEYHCIGVLR